MHGLFYSTLANTESVCWRGDFMQPAVMIVKNHEMANNTPPLGPPSSLPMNLKVFFPLSINNALERKKKISLFIWLVGVKADQ
jgi:hypothetical protein